MKPPSIQAATIMPGACARAATTLGLRKITDPTMDPIVINDTSNMFKRRRKSGAAIRSFGSGARRDVRA